MSSPRANFDVLSRDEQAAAIRRMADAGTTDYTIAAATGLSVEMIRSILADRAKRQDVAA